MFEFSPPDAEHKIDLAINRVILCYGSTIGLLSLMDWFASKGCGIHSMPQAPDYETMVNMTRNVRSTAQGNTVLFITNPKLSLPTYATHLADMILLGESADAIIVQKDRGHHPPNRVFICRGTSSPTGRTLDPSSPRLLNMPIPTRPPLGTGDKEASVFFVDGTKQRLRFGYSMGATVKKPEPACPMCEAGLPLTKSKTVFETDKPRLTIMRMSDKTLTLNGSNGREFIRIDAEGNAFVRGEKVAASQQDIYEMFRAWVRSQYVTVSTPVLKAGEVDAQGDAFTPKAVEQAVALTEAWIAGQEQPTLQEHVVDQPTPRGGYRANFRMWHRLSVERLEQEKKLDEIDNALAATWSALTVAEREHILTDGGRAKKAVTGDK